MRKILCLVIISLFCLSSILPVVNSIYVEKDINFLENSLDMGLRLPNSNRWMKTFGGKELDFGYCVQQTIDGGYIITGYTYSFGAGNSDFWLIKTDDNGVEIWNKTFGGTKRDSGKSVQQTSDEGYIITGETVSFSAGNGDVWLIKTDSNGDKVWDRTFGGTQRDFGFSVQQTSDEGYIITGYTYSFGANNEDLWLIKTDNNGNEEWNRTYGKASYISNHGQLVQQTTDGGYIIIGDIWSTGTEVNAWLIKTNNNGEKLWDKIFGGKKYDECYSVKETSGGGYIVTGYTRSFGVGGSNVWLIKTDNNGNEEWNKTFGGAYSDTGYSVQQTKDEGYIITGYTYSFGAGNSDFWLIKTDNNGNEEWNKTFGGIYWDEGHCVHKTKDEGYIITGYTYSFGTGNRDVWLIKTDSQGKPKNTSLDNMLFEKFFQRFPFFEKILNQIKL